MEQRRFGNMGEVSALTLGGGGTGQVWGPTSQEEAVATVKAAVDWGITFLDAAPTYGDGKAEDVIGEAFGGRLPDGVRVSTKCRLGNPPPGEVLTRLRASLSDSLARMKLERVDFFFLHNMIVADEDQASYDGTPRTLFVESVIPAFETLKKEGLIGAWGITGIGVPDAILETIESDPPPQAIQVITNLLDSPGALKRFEGPAKPREIAAAAHRRGVGVMGIRAVQAGALTSEFDRQLPEDHPDLADYRRAAAFRDLSRELGESPAALAHQYALSMDGVATVILGVKNRAELEECVEAEAKGRLAPEVMARIDGTVVRG
ncbi:MAG TPA: aldo/keto reductase [Dehalococcoidia bacterium]|nr:aldo/keto reductase [Dehalococcoidia bacterium]